MFKLETGLCLINLSVMVMIETGQYLIAPVIMVNTLKNKFSQIVCSRQKCVSFESACLSYFDVAVLDKILIAAN